HGCKFCNQGNREDARAAGLSEAEINALEDPDSDALSAQDRAVLALGERLSLLTEQGAVDTELHARLATFFDDAQILELGFVGSVLSGVAKFLFSFDLVEREESCPFHPAA
ncbi:MAG: carboxymuconolactone decarboxylase family protein, partial [Betaproteobacteria bacterium]|nr:carboxymuconolactone decarboxylase family protein [Betaproteobacteria bacterium]